MDIDHIALIVSSEECLRFYEKLGFNEIQRFERDHDTVGNGLSLAIDRYNILKTAVDGNLAIDSLTTTNVFFLSAFGIWGIGYSIGWVVGIMKAGHFSIMTRLLLFILFMVILNKEPHYNLMITYVILFYLCKENFVIDTVEDSILK